LSILSRVSPTNSERTSPLIYPANPCGICVEHVIELQRLGCVTWNSWSSPSSDHGSSWPWVEELSADRIATNTSL
jgi:hypothetical protein